jgi:hypothetical protein
MPRTRSFPEARPPGQKAAVERRQAQRARKGRVPRLKRAEKRLLAPRRRSTPLVGGNGKADEGRPGAQFNRDAERWLKHVPQKWNRFCDKDMLKQNAPGLFDIVKKVWAASAKVRPLQEIVLRSI